MKHLLLALTVVLLVAAVATAQPAAVRTVAIADFVDESHDGTVIQAAHLNSVLQRLLTERGAGRIRVVAVDETRAAMRAQGVTVRELVSPTKATALAQAVGADWLVTGRWLSLDAEVLTLPLPTDPTQPVVAGFLGGSLLEIRVLEASTRRIVLQESVSSNSRGFSRIGVLIEAARLALLRAADRILAL